MKCIQFMLLVEVMSLVDSRKLFTLKLLKNNDSTNLSTGRPLTNRGSYEISLASTKPKRKAEIIFMMCLPKVPENVHATARPSKPYLPHKFNVTILAIKKLSFLVELERVDQDKGWDTMQIIVDWFSYIKGNGMVYQNLILWFPDATDRRTINVNMASKYCNDNGGRLVDIVDKAMYDVVYNYCRQTIVFGSHVEAFTYLGLSYNPTTNTVTQSNGKPGYNGDWHPGGPSELVARTRLVLVIRPPSSTSPDHGMYNYPPKAWNYTVTQLCSTNLM
uniref:uncharacterized protein LOC108950537 n=1 Tax=Ciona intestinalis TaxID=7719 RepID=UPI00089DD5EC|nr:uncharacterized protein LOC108950537 [Ciona intestinalis]|eukprot:XP_018672028.1 uncharacterized protein LOC108950537 [Ciona intestinalis]